jgi:hypothetical protein
MAYFREEWGNVATPLHEESVEKKVCLEKKGGRIPLQATDYERIECIIRRIEENRRDVTTPYRKWFRIGLALASIFGNDGYIALMGFDGNEHTISLTDIKVADYYTHQEEYVYTIHVSLFGSHNEFDSYEYDASALPVALVRAAYDGIPLYMLITDNFGRAVKMPASFTMKGIASVVLGDLFAGVSYNVSGSKNGVFLIEKGKPVQNAPSAEDDLYYLKEKVKDSYPSQIPLGRAYTTHIHKKEE